MANPKSLVDVNEGTSVSTNSPQSPTGSALLEIPITLDFDPMSFQCKEDSPLTSPSDSNREIGEMLSPSQNADVVDFFDPFWPVKEESPTDYYPNVMLGQTSDPLVDTLNEQPQQQFSNGFPDYEISENKTVLNETSHDDLIDIDNSVRNDQILDLSESIDDGQMNELPESVDRLDEPIDRLDYNVDRLEETIDAFDEPIYRLDEQADRLDEPVDRLDEPADRLDEPADRLDEPADRLDEPIDRLDEPIDRLDDFPDKLDDASDKLDGIIDQSDEAIDKSEDSVDRSNNAIDRADEILADYYPNSEHSPVPSSKSEITGDDLITELEQTRSEETCVSPVTEQVFDDNKHDSSEHDQTLEDDLYRRSRTSSSASSQSSKSERTEKRIAYRTTESSLKEDKKITTNSVSMKNEKSIQKKEIQTKKGSVIKTETNGYSSHNGVEESTVSLKNSKNEKFDATSPKSPECQTSVTDLMSTYVSLTAQESHLPSTKEIISTGIDIKSLKSNYAQNKGEYRGTSPDREIINTGIDMKALKSSFTKSSDDTQQSILQEEVKPSVDRVKVQRTFSQSNVDELCLCKICGKHVYQMEKMKAEKSVFHKNCFRCKECNKLLNVDTYSSNEGDIYCKPHFKQLFQPKARFDGEDAAPRKQRRNEMIIRENTPAELPPDVVRSDSKPDHGLENIPVNLSSIKSKFETFQEEHHLPSTTDVCTLQRSASVMARLAKYQSKVSGNENENGDLSESDNDEELCSEDTSVIKPSKHKEKVVFSGMSSLKSQWETGSVAATKEERMEEKKEELNKLRQRICLGRSESMKAVYEKACQDTSKVKPERPESVVDLGRDVKAIRIKEKFEKGELVSEVEEENLEKVRKEKEEDLSALIEPGIANDAKKLFKQIDATVMTTPAMPARSPNKSPLSERHVNLNSPVKNVDVVKCSEPTEKEEIVVDTTDVSQRFKFFENYSESPKERKRFQITPPREPAKEDTPDKDVAHDPNVVRCIDTVDDIPSTDTARRMLDKFKQLEKETPSAPAGPKPLKRITPPREYTKVDDHDSSPEPERDPNVIRSSYKADDDIIVEADKAKSLKAKFENWDAELANRRNEDEQDEDYLPQVDTTKTLRAKFEAIKEDTLKPVEKPKSKVNRFIHEQTASSTDLCNICNKKVYPMEKMETSGMRLHKNCFRCAHCSCMLRLENYTKSGRRLYCTPHFKQLFISRGNYDEGFGREQHKEKWNRSCNNSTVSRDLHENEEIEYSNGDVQCLEQTA